MVNRGRTFSGVPTSVALARRYVLSMLSGYPSGTLERVELMVSELASNCVEHARTDFTIRLHLAGGTVRCEISDGGSGEPRLQPRDAERLGGRGLLIVDALSDDWGSEPVPGDGKIVWFTVSDQALATSAPALKSVRDG